MRKKKIMISLCILCMVCQTSCGLTEKEQNNQKQEKEVEQKKEKETETKEEIEKMKDENIEKKTELPEGSLEEDEVAIKRSLQYNPITGQDENGAWQYGGDPAVLVDNDTIYLYTGRDASSDEEVKKAIYVMREWVCYSTKDLEHWEYEGSIMKADTKSISWATGSTSAWASQVAKHYDSKKEKDQYYLYYCTWDKTSAGKMSIKVAVSDSPTGPFHDKGEPLVKGTLTEPQTSNWNDIDPTVWVETDDSGEEHRYLAWGNGRFYLCELNEDMISVKDLNGDGKITCGYSAEKADILAQGDGINSFTEAPWLYRRTDENGKYYGPYYLFYANGWREKMAYATTENLLEGKWKFGKVLMMPTATSNTNHMAVFDFQGKTYFIYHNGSLPGGNGYRRTPCITELHFNKDGSIEAIQETASGLGGAVFSIYQGEEYISHKPFLNSSADNDYPYTDIELGSNLSDVEQDKEWVITAGKADTSKAAYISIQSENKPGLYITANEDKTVTLAQDIDASEDTAKKQTFRTRKGLNGKENTISFESVSQQGMYLTMKDNILCLTDGTDKEATVFSIK